MAFINNNRPFGEDEVCETCHKNLNDLTDGTVECDPCYNAMMQHIAERGVLGHLWDMLYMLFDMHFTGTLTAFIWSIQKLFKVGDYNPETGVFANNTYHPERDDFN